MNSQKKLQDFMQQATPYDPKPTQPVIEAKVRSRKGKLKSEPVSISNLVIDEDDPQKGKWGGKSEVDGRKLSAKVVKSKTDEDWYFIDLKVESTLKDKPLTGQVTFYLHDSFRPDRYTIKVKNGIAEVKELGAYEAFTVGASCDNNTTKLELDLNKAPGVPAGFRY